MGPLLARGAATVALGALNPFLAVIPFIETGPGEDSNCGELLREVKSAGVAPRSSSEGGEVTSNVVASPELRKSGAGLATAQRYGVAAEVCGGGALLDRRGAVPAAAFACRDANAFDAAQRAMEPTPNLG
jgi:hypothetical protein